MGSLIRLIIMFIRLATPWVIRAATGVVGTIFAMIVILWTGVPTAVERIADEWTQRAVDAGFPTAHAAELHRAIQFVAFVVIVAMWVLFAFATVWLIGRIF